MTREQYFAMCEQMGMEPRKEEIPPDPSDLSLEVQYALLLFSTLPDKVGGMSGVWLGKDFGGLIDIMEIYQIENKKEVLEYLLVCIEVAGKHYAEQHKAMETQSKAKIRS